MQINNYVYECSLRRRNFHAPLHVIEVQKAEHAHSYSEVDHGVPSP